MKFAQRQDLIDRLAREIQVRFKSYEIDQGLLQLGVTPPGGDLPHNSKWAYAKVALANESVRKLLKIADELGVDVPTIAGGASLPPKMWEQVGGARLFVSHLSAHKSKATRLRDCLELHNVSAFVAHEDIIPTLDWQKEIEKALRTMDAFLAVHTKGFSDSSWCQQEVGFAVARDVKIISLRMDEDPTGFLASRQALSRNNRSAEEIAAEIKKLLALDDRTKGRFLQSSPNDEIPF